MIAQFALMLMLGMSLMWALMPRAQVTAGFFRIQMMIALGLGVLAILTLGSLTPVVETSSVDRWILPLGWQLAWLRWQGMSDPSSGCWTDAPAELSASS